MSVNVSVIIPAYNAEKYIKECIDSVLAQKLDNYEIIVVNDASTDGTADILEFYQKMDSKVCIYTQKINKKQGAARNLGVKNAKGKYVFFLDADDLLADENALLEMYSVAERNAADIVFCNYIIFDKNKNEQKYEHVHNPYLGSMSIDKKKALITTSVVPWAKLIRKSLIIENNIEFPENIFYEDQATTYLYYLYAKKTCKVDDFFYKYRMWDNSTTNQSDSKRHFQHLDSALLLYNRLKERGFEKEYIAEIEYFLFEQMYILGIKNSICRFTILPHEYIKNLLHALEVNCCKIQENIYFKNYVSENNKNIYLMHKRDQKKLLDTLLCNQEVLGCPNYMMSLCNNEKKIELLIDWLLQTKREVTFWGAEKYAQNLISLFRKQGFIFSRVTERDIYKVGAVYEEYIIEPISNIVTESIIFEPYQNWMCSIKEEVRKRGLRVYLFNFEVYIKFDLHIPINEYLEKIVYEDTCFLFTTIS